MDHVDDARLPALVEHTGDAASAVSPFATPGALRVSAGVFDADDPAAALAARWLLRYPAGTRAVYGTDLAEWFRFCERLGTTPLEARLDHADAYARYLAEAPRLSGRPLAASTVQRKLSAASSFYRYLVGIRVLTDSPFLGVARPAVSPDSPTTGLDVAEMRRLRAAAAADGPRSEALVTLLLNNGLRISEALACDVEHLGYDRGHRILRLHRKGGKVARAPLAPPTAHAVDAYIGSRASGPIFITATGRRMDRHAAFRLVQRLARAAEVPAAADISPHSVRHSFATAALDAGAELRDVQDAMGHADPRTTRRYDRGRHNLDRHATYAVAQTLADTGG